MSVETRSQSELYLLGQPVTELCSIRLASNGEALGLFCQLHLSNKLQKRQASSMVVEKVTDVWNRAQIPTCRKDHAINKLELLYTQWTTLKKHKDRESDLHVAQENDFCSKMENLFDIAHADALTIIRIQEDRDFLLAQREPGRRGYMGPVDKELAEKEERKKQRLEAENRRRDQAEACSTSTSVILESSSEGEDKDTGASDSEFATPPRKKVRQPRATTNIMTPSLAAALDRSKISDRKATFVMAETAHSLGHCIDDLNINRSSIKRHREKCRAQRAAALKSDFAGDTPLVVHWDGKLMADLSGKEHTDRLPIIVSGHGVSQLLKVSKVSGGSGENQSSAVVQCLEEWNLQSRVVAMCFDTTSSNTGIHNGACILIERKLDKELLHLACRHHIMELLAGAAFAVSMSPSSAPEVLLFKRFQQRWSFIDQGNFSTSADASELADILNPVKVQIIDFAEGRLAGEKLVRDDYREFLELSIIFLGGSPQRGIHFMAPGPMHHARWMSKVIYSLKVWMFRSQFRLTAFEEKGLLQMCLFAVILYLKAWFMAPLAVSAPRHDLSLLQDIYKYRQHNEAISKAACKKLEHHLWYLSDELVGLAFFDSEVPVAVKRKMVQALTSSEATDQCAGPKRITLTASNASTASLEDFVNGNTQKLFRKLQITDDFLNYDPELWATRDDYQQGINIVNALLVTNDNAERGVALVQELNKLITHDEEQFQFLLQVVADHRRQFSSCRKSLLRGQSSPSDTN